MRFSCSRKACKTIGKTLFCAIRKTRSENLIKHVVYDDFWRHFGGCGKLEHLVSVFQETNVDAALAASVFHYNKFSISTLKKFLLENLVLVRT